ncbi:MAG: peptidoglycan DD-metalloendopeptidase family protein [bacterium]|nr:peptidoglycan DD-metalloendopeptidase family protein [bacterium]
MLFRNFKKYTTNTEKQNRKDFKILAFLVLSIFIFYIYGTFFPNTPVAKADTIDDLKQKIEERNSLVKRLEKEIEAYKLEVEKAQKESNTLSGVLKTLDLSKKKLLKDIDLTKEKIKSVNYDIDRLSLQIKGAENSIDTDKRIIASALAIIRKSQDQDTLELLLSGQSLSETWDEVEQMNSLQSELKIKIAEILKKKTALSNIKTESEDRKQDLISFTNNLSAQTKSVEQTAKEKATLLAQTKSKESEYKKLMADRQAKKDAFEAEISALENELKIAIDPRSLPPVGSGVLKWPLAGITSLNFKSFVTQYFGNTEFATKNPQIYSGKGHNAIDLRAIIGTQIASAGSGKITATGDTDIYCPRASLGKWVLINHNNGLSTLYAHLSSISVNAGDAVKSGQTLGLSGNTGYSTGPHLHFGVYATEGIEVRKFTTSINCKNATIPISSQEAKLNPLSYL